MNPGAKSWLDGEIDAMCLPDATMRKNPSLLLLTPLILIILAFDAWAAEAERNLTPRQIAAYATAQSPRDGKFSLVAVSTATDHPAGQIFRDCSNCPEMVVVPAGTFRMGSPTREIGRNDNEEPRRQISIKPLAIGRFEVTHGQFADFVNTTRREMTNGCWLWTGARDDEGRPFAEWRSERSWLDPGFAQSDNHPVTCVSWNDARAYVQWLSTTTGKPYRLLTEAEWEYAARAGSATPFSFGSDTDALCRFGNGADQTLQRAFPGRVTANCNDGHLYTAPVGSFAANAFGLYDMHGNASEWVQDCFRLVYDTGRTDGRAVDPRVCRPYRTFRGGSWGSRPISLRSAARFPARADAANNVLGIRVARSLP